MTLKERFRRVMHFQPVDKVPNFEFGYWAETLPAWHEQGLPIEINDEAKAYAYFGIENWRGVPVNTGMTAGLGRARILESNDEYEIGLDDIGTKYQINKVGHKSIPHYIEFPIKTREDFKPFLEKLPPGPEGRYPSEADWQAFLADVEKDDRPVCLGISSMIGTPRNWMGFETCAMMVYDDPVFLEEMVEAMCVVVETTIERALREAPIDFALGWEDICFNSGPIVGRRFYEEVVAPRYRRISSLLRKYGVDVIGVDCDGNLSPIADVMLDAGYNFFFPTEVHGGTDPVGLRDQYGQRALFSGGVDKHALRKGKKAIEKELLRLQPVVEEGGFIPHVDHRCPADVTFADYVFYLKLKREILHCGGPPAEALGAESR